MARESLRSVTDGHVEEIKPSGGSGKPTGEKFISTGHKDEFKSGHRKIPIVIENGGDFTCRKNTDIPFKWFKK